jgi:hypothetical protein
VIAPAGAIVSLYVDLVARVQIDDIIETRSGRRYQALEVRVQKRGKNVGRQHLRCRVMDEGERHPYEGMTPDHPLIPTVHRIRWYRRERGAGVKARGRR